jgi:uncharacterized protein YyaL (SSP411 family)
MPNRLAHESSPYLLQHKDNPVDWHAWGDEALAEARERDIPLLISIGYSACHWCHVMERESFEDPDVAAYMNDHFVCIKVDREERPDVDAIYMDAVQAMTGHGGWPLNAFATPDQVPFYCGTYFPPEHRQGMPSWRMVLEAMADAWATRRDEIVSGAPRILERLRGGAAIAPSGEPLRGETLDAAVARFGEIFDQVNAGWGGAPKFPAAGAIDFLLARPEPGAREMALTTLHAMAAGGIHDQVGGGFARYAVDTTWTVPHFEKMLYDNALLARAYLHGWQVSGDERLREVTEQALEFMLRELRGPEGGFMAALDADSEGVEGKYYVFTVDELRAELDDELADAAIAYFGATAGGNFEGANVLEARGPRPERLPEIRRELYGARERRVRPGLDDKRITSWNALAISAFADAGAALGRDDLVDAARAAAVFLLDELRDEGGRLRRTWKNGTARIDGLLEDYAYTVEALLTLYEATFEERWFVAARELADVMIAAFGDDEQGGFFTTAADAEALAIRRKDVEDAPIPSGQSSAAYGLLRLSAFTGEAGYERRAVGVLDLHHALAVRHPQAFAHLLRALDFHLGTVREVALVGADVRELAGVVRSALRPRVVVAGGDGTGDGDVPLLAGRPAGEGGAALAYVCEHFACQAPTADPAALAAALNA